MKTRLAAAVVAAALLVPAVAVAKTINLKGSLTGGGGHPGSSVSFSVTKNKAGKPIKITKVSIKKLRIVCSSTGVAKAVSVNLGKFKLDQGRAGTNKTVGGVNYNFNTVMTRKVGSAWGSVRGQTTADCFGSATFMIKPTKKK